MKYLTRSYVRALGLEELVFLDLNNMAVWITDGAVFPRAAMHQRICVEHGGRRYQRSECGLSYDLIPEDV